MYPAVIAGLAAVVVVTRSKSPPAVQTDAVVTEFTSSEEWPRLDPCLGREATDTIASAPFVPPDLLEQYGVTFQPAPTAFRLATVAGGVPTGEALAHAASIVRRERLRFSPGCVARIRPVHVLFVTKDCPELEAKLNR